MATCDESCATKAAGSTIVKLGLQKCWQIRLDQSQRTHRTFKAVCSCTWILDTFTESKADSGPGRDVCALSFCAGGSVGPCYERTLRKAWICVNLHHCECFLVQAAVMDLQKVPEVWWQVQFDVGSLLRHSSFEICARLISFVFPGRLIFEASNCQGQAPSSGMSSCTFCPEWLFGTGPMGTHWDTHRDTHWDMAHHGTSARR